MKKALSSLARKLSFFLALSVMLTQFPFLPAKADTVNVKIGVISDIHLTDSSSLQTEETNLRNALTTFKQNGINVLMVAGDMTNAGATAAYDKFNTIFNEVFNSGTVPQKVFTMGNHDYWNGLTATLAQWRFESELGVDVNTSITVNGYHFIGVSTEDGEVNGTFTSTSTDFLSNSLAAAAADDPTKPIFVAVHQPVTGTVYDDGGWSNPALDSVLKNYPQAVVFAGHTHFPIQDERAICQKDYTSVATSTLSYASLEGGKINSDPLPGAHDVAQGLLVTVTNSSASIKRLDFHSNTQIKSDWTISLPVNKANFTYTDARAAARTAPYFAAGSVITVNQITPSSCSFTFPSALDDDFVYSYKVQAVNMSTGAVDSQQLAFSDFYLGIPNMAATQTFNLMGLTANTNYEIRIYGVESFGKQSTIPLTLPVTTLPNDTGPGQDVLTVDFANQTAADRSQYNTSYKKTGSGSISLDSSINKYVQNFDGSTYINYSVNDDQLLNMSSQFTVEAAFKMDTLQDQGILENLESSGLGFEGESSGSVLFYARIGGSYKTLSTQCAAGQYYYLTATYDGSTLSLYSNGKLVSTMAVTGSVTHNDVVKMCLGGNPNTGGTANLLFDGSIALARIYNRCIGAADVQDRYYDFWGPSADILNLNFANSNGQDISTYNTSYTQINSPSYIYDSSIGKNVLSLNGTNYINYSIGSDQKSLITNQFTLEAVFSMNSIKNQAIVENTEQSGIGFESTSSGYVEVWARIAGAYKRVGVQLSANTYYDLTATYDGREIDLYLNGTLVNSMTNVSGTINQANVAMCVGGDPNTQGTASLLFDGKIGLVRISSKAISAKEAAARYQKYFGSGTDILNVNFSDGTPNDYSSYTSQYVTKGPVPISYDSSISKNVLTVDGTGHINYRMTNTQLSQITDQFTIEAVFSMDTIRNQAIFENTEASGLGFESTSTGVVNVYAYINGYKSVGVQLSTNTYYHLVATYDGTALRLYLNGSLVNTLTGLSGAVKHMSSIPVCIGGNPDGTTGGATLPFDGKIAEVRITNKCIGASEVASRYTQFFS